MRNHTVGVFDFGLRIFDIEIPEYPPNQKSSILNQKSPRWRMTDPIGPDPPRAQQGDTTS
ncbi:MAG: hypothetical protein IT445_12920 [Phycisphaeraceae bacterium]|nr:hypothetical protein [Phycisphaeraceae bacterium]